MPAKLRLYVLKSNDIQISMDGKGRWVDNVMVERLWRSVKYEEALYTTNFTEPLSYQDSAFLKLPKFP